MTCSLTVWWLLIVTKTSLIDWQGCTPRLDGTDWLASVQHEKKRCVMAWRPIYGSGEGHRIDPSPVLSFVRSSLWS